MKRIRTWRAIAALIAVFAILIGCGGGGGEGGGGGGIPAFTAADAANAQAATNALQATFAAGFDAANVAGSLNTFAAAARARGDVESATVLGDQVIVKYRNGWNHSWVVNPPFEEPVWIDVNTLMEGVESREFVGNRKGILLNTVTPDPRFTWVAPVLGKIATYLNGIGFTGKTAATVDSLEGAACDVNAFTNLGGYGFVGIITHGVAEGNTGRVWLLTGDVADLTEYVGYFPDVWNGRMGSVTSVVADATGPVYRNVWKVSDKFFADKYAANAFPHTVFFNGACQGYLNGQNANLANALIGKGVAAYLGYTESQGVSPYAMFAMVTKMGCTKDLGFSYDRLPDSLKTQGPATLRFLPAGARSVQLSENGCVDDKISVTAPTEGGTVNARVLTVTGRITAIPEDASAYIDINGSATALVMDGSGNFSQNVAVQQGANTVTVGYLSREGSQAKIVHFTANIPPMALWTQLAWNTYGTDVDFHLLGPDLTMSAAFSSQDCYYGNKNPAFGASLDVDDVDGYGPEHITMNNATTGKHILFVHYYSAHGVTAPSNTQVRVSLNNAATLTFGPRQLVNSGADIWIVCEIDFPNNRVTPINQMTTREHLIAMYPQVGRLLEANKKR